MRRRDGMIQLLEDAKNGKFDVVITEGLDRLARNQADMHKIYDILDFHGIGIYALSKHGFVDDLDVTFTGYQHARFSKDLGQKVKRGQRGAVKRGSICGSVAYGYKIFRSVEVPRGGGKSTKGKRKSFCVFFVNSPQVCQGSASSNR